MTARTKRHIVSLFYHVAVLSSVSGGVYFAEHLKKPPLALWAVCIMVIHILTFRVFSVAGFVQRIFILKTSCRSCRTDIFLTDQWQCGCGYVGYRHAFSPCPSCKIRFSWIDCPSCGASIPV